jgi:YfiR/HmsC-like
MMRVFINIRSVFRTRLLGAILALGIIPTSTPNAEPDTSEQTVTVAFLYNFLKFTQWPADTLSAELTLCVSNEASFGEELDAITGKSAQTKVVHVKRIELNDDVQECQLLFLSRDENHVRILQWLKNTATLPILTVSDADKFLDMGGMIVLSNADNHIQFEVNLKQVVSTRLSLSGQLLKIAHAVREQ